MQDGFAFQKQRTPEYLHKYQLAIDDRVTLQRSDQTDSGNRPLMYLAIPSSSYTICASTWDTCTKPGPVAQNPTRFLHLLLQGI